MKIKVNTRVVGYLLTVYTYQGDIYYRKEYKTKKEALKQKELSESLGYRVEMYHIFDKK